MSTRPQGIFIVFEGGDGVGKSTQSELLAAHLRDTGREVVSTFEPGDTLVGAKIREILLNPDTGKLSEWAEALLYAADKANHVQQLIRPALARGAVVICDRYIDSMLAYQGAGRVLDLAAVSQVIEWATCGVRPDLTILLDLDPAQAVGDIAQKDRLESESLAFHARVREHFLQLAADRSDYLVLPARESITHLATEIASRVAML